MKLVLGIVALCAVSGAASAAQPWIMSFEPLTADYAVANPMPQTRASNSVVFSAMTPNPGTGQFSAFAPAAGAIGFDDYDSTLAGGNAFLQAFRFVGGLTAPGAMRVDFYDSAANLVNFFTVNLPAGNSIWNIGLESVAGAKDSTFLIPDAGFVELSTPAGITGQWFLATPAPTVGTESRAAGMGSLGTHSHRFELTVPAPGAMALLGLGGLVAARRRRA